MFQLTCDQRRRHWRDKGEIWNAASWTLKFIFFSLFVFSLPKLIFSPQTFFFPPPCVFFFLTSRLAPLRSGLPFGLAHGPPQNNTEKYETILAMSCTDEDDPPLTFQYWKDCVASIDLSSSSSSTSGARHKEVTTGMHTNHGENLGVI